MMLEVMADGVPSTDQYDVDEEEMKGGWKGSTLQYYISRVFGYQNR